VPGIDVTVNVVTDEAIVAVKVVVTVGGMDVGTIVTIVVGGRVWTGAEAGGDTQPAVKIAAHKNTIVIISVLVLFI
jgi:hypothetical protein